HVPAKRYLCATEPGYIELLAEDSARSLALQGGPMSAEEITKFELTPYFAAAVRLRRIDDRAKAPDATTSPFSHFIPVIDKALLKVPARCDRQDRCQRLRRTEVPLALNPVSMLEVSLSQRGTPTPDDATPI